MVRPSAFSPEQIDRYLEYIQLPKRFHLDRSPPRDYEFLHILHVHQLSTIPYENLLLHYSKDHAVSLGPQDLYKKIMSGNGRGGYCMENSIFFNHILRGLGFDAFVTGARIRLRKDGVPGGDYVGWRHIVNIVTLSDNSRYMVDISFGGDGATLPLPLIDGHISPNIGTQQLRLVYDTLPEQNPLSDKSWIYQYRNAPEKPWNSYYAFSTNEWMLIDFDAANEWLYSNPISFQTQQVLVVKFVRERHEGREGENGSNAEDRNAEGEKIVGKRMLADAVVKENMGGKTTVVKVCQTEAERVNTLRDVFGIRLTAEEIGGIKGFRTQLPLEHRE